MHAIKFYKIHTKHERLRSDIVVGMTLDMPRVGAPFVMYAEALDPKAAVRRVNTSEVLSVSEDAEGFLFETVSGSVYRVELQQQGLDETAE